MLEAGLPRAFVLCMFLLSYTAGIHQGQSDLDAVEMFAGDRSVTSALQRPTVCRHTNTARTFRMSPSTVRCGLKAIPLDIRYDPHMCDINGSAGFASAP